MISPTKCNKSIFDNEIGGVYSDIFEAVIAGRRDEVKQILSRGDINLNHSDKHGQTPLFVASFKGHDDVVQLLLDKSNVNFSNRDGRTSLIMASFKGHKNIVKMLLERGADLNHSDKYGWTPLLIACKEGHMDVIELLLERCADVNHSDSDGRTALIMSSFHGCLDVVNLILNRGCNVNLNCTDKHGQTPLFVASFKGHTGVVETLLKSGADVNLTDKDDWTALLIASQNGHSDIVKMLLSKRAEVNCTDKHGQTPLIMACQNGHIDVAEMLLERGADVHLAHEDGQNPLIMAALNGHKDIVELLLYKRADVNSFETKHGQTAIFMASQLGHAEIVQLLIDKGAMINIFDLDYWSPLLLASQNGRKDVVRILVDNGAYVDITDGDGRTPLYIASVANRHEVVKLLLRNGAKVNSATRYRNTALHAAAECGGVEVVKILSEQGAFINADDFLNRKPIHYAAEKGNLEIVKHLCDNGANCNVEEGIFRWTPLHVAAGFGHLEVVKYLCERQAAVDARDKGGFTPKYYAFKDGHLDVVHFLENGNDINLTHISTPDATEESSVKEELKSFRLKLRYFFHGFKSDKILDSYRDHKYFDAFVEEYLITGNEVKDLNERIRPEVEKLLIRGESRSIRNADPKFWDRDRLIFCLDCENEEIFAKGLKLIVDYSENGVEVLGNMFKISHLMKMALQNNLSSAVEHLGSLNAEINSLAIDIVYRYGRWALLGKLLKQRVKKLWQPVKLVNFSTYLMQAQIFDKHYYGDGSANQMDFGKCIDLLIEYTDYDVNERNADQYSALHLAGMYNRTDAIMNLLDKGAYIGLQDKRGRPIIWNISAKILKDHFDRCIEDETKSISIDFKNLIAPSEDFPNDMTAIEFMANSSEHQDLLQHPLMEKFLHIKWNRVAHIFYWDIFLYFLFWIMTGSISVCYASGLNQGDPRNKYGLMFAILSISIVYISGRQIIQGRYSSNYYKCWTNIFKIFLSILTVGFLLFFIICIPLQFYTPTGVAVYIILITYGFFTLAGSMWFFSIYAEMFLVVTWNAIKSLQLYVIFLPAFSALFYVLLIDSTPGGEDGPQLNKFSSFSGSMVKTIVMSIGEMDANSISNLNVNSLGAFILIAFIFFISIIFMNLMSGLAVSDTQKISRQAKFTSIKKRIQLLTQYEDILRCRGKNTNIDVLRQYKRIYIEIDEDKKPVDKKIYWTDLLSDSCCTTISSISTKKLLRILEKRELEKHRHSEKNEHSELIDRITKIEDALMKIEDISIPQIENTLAKLEERMKLEQITKAKDMRQILDALKQINYRLNGK